LVRLRASAGVGLVTLAAIAVAIYLLELFPPAAFGATTPLVAANALAQTAWAGYVAQLAVSPVWFAVKIPTWIALAGIVAAALAALRGGRDAVTP
jgi:glutathione S-transferase